MSMNAWDWVIWIHVLSAIIGIGPTFFMPVFVRKGQTRQQMNHSLEMMAKLEMYPKIGGPLAVLTGIALVVFRSYGSFLQVWQIGALILFIVVQVIIIGFVVPRTKKLHMALANGDAERNEPLDVGHSGLADQVRGLLFATNLLGVALFSLMILKP